MRQDRGTARLVRSSENILLRRLSPADQLLLEPHASEISVSRATTSIGSNAPIDAIFFPGTAVYSLIEEAMGTRCAEIAVVGREGMIGWPALLGCATSTHAAVCQTRGSAVRIPLDALRAAERHSTTLQASLLRFVHLVMVQMARAIASHAQDALDQRLARWLLMRHDRVGGDILLVQHAEIADRLSVRRASVTDRLHVLEGLRLVRCNRGRIAIRDRMALEDFAGGSYGVVENHYRALIAPFGKSMLPTPGAVPAGLALA